MDSGIGATLRKARARREIELSEVEAATRIRARFLRAIEDEDWEALPGDVYARGFVRTYAAYLGLDGNRLAEEVGRQISVAAERAAAVAPPPERHVRRSPARSSTPGRPVVAVTVLAVVGLAVAILLASGGEDPVRVEGARVGTAGSDRPAAIPPEPAGAPQVTLELAASGEVWICLLDAGERPLVNGRILAPGAEEGPFRSGSFTVSFGNGEVSMTIDGQEARIPATASPIGYAIGGDGAMRPLPEGERPECL